MAVFASLVLSPRASEAGCGDYVWIRGRTVPTLHSMTDQPTPGQPTNGDGSSDDAAEHGSPHRPCHGPGCSDGSIPAEAPVRGVVVSIDRWAMAPGDTLPDCVCCNNMLAEPFDFVADGFRLSILRPPR